MECVHFLFFVQFALRPFISLDFSTCSHLLGYSLRGKRNNCTKKDIYKEKEKSSLQEDSPRLTNATTFSHQRGTPHPFIHSSEMNTRTPLADSGIGHQHHTKITASSGPEPCLCSWRAGLRSTDCEQEYPRYPSPRSCPGVPLFCPPHMNYRAYVDSP